VQNNFQNTSAVLFTGSSSSTATAGIGGHTSVHAHTSDSGDDTSTLERPSPAPTEPEYDEATGAPTNTAGRKALMMDWVQGARTGTKPRVVQLQFDMLKRVTDNFDELTQIGGGASCAVFRGQIFGVLVAIKVRRAPRTRPCTH
jgi:hypothetical protein